jgi:hypothetical protein
MGVKRLLPKVISLELTPFVVANNGDLLGQMLLVASHGYLFSLSRINAFLPPSFRITTFIFSVKKRERERNENVESEERNTPFFVEFGVCIKLRIFMEDGKAFEIMRLLVTPPALPRSPIIGQVSYCTTHISLGTCQIQKLVKHNL